MKLKLPAGDFDAYLFDCDGTIVDSMPLHYIAWTLALKDWKCEFDEELFYQWGGKPSMEIIADLSKMQGLEMPVQAVAERKESLYFELLPELRVVPEVLEHIEAQQGRIPYAVVTGGRRESATRSLSAVGLLNRFETIVCAGEYARSKPHPDPFLIAAERLGVEPGKCLAFEDTDLGIQAATAAGMASVRVPTPLERRQAAQAM